MLARIGFVFALWRSLRLAWRLFRDRRIPLWRKAIAPMALLYLVSPPGLLLGAIPVLGQLDDLTILFLALMLFIRLCPSELVREHRESMAGRRRPDGVDPSKVIDGEYKILE